MQCPYCGANDDKVIDLSALDCEKVASAKNWKRIAGDAGLAALLVSPLVRLPTKLSHGNGDSGKDVLQIYRESSSLLSGRSARPKLVAPGARRNLPEARLALFQGSYGCPHRRENG